MEERKGEWKKGEKRVEGGWKEGGRRVGRRVEGGWKKGWKEGGRRVERGWKEGGRRVEEEMNKICEMMSGRELSKRVFTK